jgi:hypothetical protein
MAGGLQIPNPGEGTVAAVCPFSPGLAEARLNHASWGVGPPPFGKGPEHGLDCALEVGGGFVRGPTLPVGMKGWTAPDEYPSTPAYTVQRYPFLTETC